MVPKKSVRHFATQSRTVLSGSEKAPLAEAGGEKPAPLAARITVSVIVRRKTPLKAEHITGEQRLTRAQFDDSRAADPVRAYPRETQEFYVARKVDGVDLAMVDAAWLRRQL